MIEVNSLGYSYASKDVVFDDLSFSVPEGAFYGVLGKNGSGKSTLLRLLSGESSPLSGEIIIPQGEVSLLSQSIILDSQTIVRDFLLFHKIFYPRYCLSIEADLLKYFEINEREKIGNLSTGQQKLVLAIACLSSKTRILLVDEITAVLDSENRARFFSKISEFNKVHKLTILLATNIFEDLEGRAKKVIYIKDSKAKIISPNKLKEHLNV